MKIIILWSKDTKKWLQSSYLMSFEMVTDWHTAMVIMDTMSKVL